MFSGHTCFGIALRLWLSHPGMEKLPCRAVAVMCPACLVMRPAHLRLAWCHQRRRPLGSVCIAGLLPLDRRLHPQNGKARQVGKTGYHILGLTCEQRFPLVGFAIGKHHDSEQWIAAKSKAYCILLLLLDLREKKDTFFSLLVCCFVARLAVKAGLSPKTSLKEP